MNLAESGVALCMDRGAGGWPALHHCIRASEWCRLREGHES